MGNVVKEEWKQVKVFNNYEVSNLGNVRNKQSLKLMKQCFDKNGYKLVNLSNKGKTKLFRVHRLVLVTFTKESDKQVNHINENKQDNKLINLEWVSCEENNNHGSRNKRVSKALSKKINQFDLNGNLINSFYGTKEAERQTGIFNQSIGQCALGKYKTAGGYIWRYDEVTTNGIVN